MADVASCAVRKALIADCWLQVSLLTNPVWVIKTRLQLQRSGGLVSKAARPLRASHLGKPLRAGPYRGFLHAVRQIASEEGWRGFYRGLWPSLLLVCCCPCSAVWCMPPQAHLSVVRLLGICDSCDTAGQMSLLSWHVAHGNTAPLTSLRSWVDAWSPSSETQSS